MAPRSIKKNRKKITQKESENETLIQKVSLEEKSTPTEKRSNKKDHKKNENLAPPSPSGTKIEFEKLKTIDLTAALSQSSGELKKKKKWQKLQLSRKAKRKLLKLKPSAFDSIARRLTKSRSSTLSTKSVMHSLDSGASGGGIIGIAETRRILLLRRSKSFSESDFDVKTSGVDEDLDKVEELAESESSSVFDDFDDGEIPEDKIDEIRQSFRKSAEYLKRKSSQPHKPQVDFFDALGEIPEIENVSLDLTLSDEEEVPMQISEKPIGEDAGMFVDPLTGAAITSSSSSLLHHTTEGQPEISMYSIEQESVVDLLGEVKIDEDEDLAAIFHTEADDDKEKVAGEKTKDNWDVSFGHMIDIRTSRTTITEEFTQAAYDEYMRKVKVFIHEFVNQLITQVVHTVEYGDRGKLISQSLDKLKIMDELDDILRKIEIEKKENFFLNAAVIKFYRMKGDIRPLKEDDPEKVKELINKQIELQDGLCNLLYQEEELKTVSALKIAKLQGDVEDAENVASHSVEDLEKLIKSAFCHDRHQYLNEVVARALKQMSNMRDLITENRIVLLKKLHTMTDLKAKEDKLENLGAGLKMRNFEVLQAAVNNLDTKISERNKDLNSLHIRHNKDLHVMTHFMELHAMMQNTINVKEAFLTDLLEEQKEARNELNSLKLTRAGIRADIAHARHQSGLADNLGLLLDYDRTMDELEAIKARISKMKNKKQELEAHFSRFEERYKRLSSI